MLSRLVQVVTVTVVRRTRRLGRGVTNLLRPARTAAALVSAASLDALRPRSALMAENAFLRQQIVALRRAAPRRPRLHREDRLILVLLAGLDRAWRDALFVVQPDTLLRWHRDLFTLVWRRKSRRRDGPRRLRTEVVDLIRTMATANVLWGAERIRGELLKLGIRASKRTVQKYMRTGRPQRERGQTWDTFLRNHPHETWACDFLQLYDAWFRPIFAFFIVSHGTREVMTPRVPRSRPDPWRSPPASGARRVGQTLQRGSTAPGDRAADPEPAGAARPRRSQQTHRGHPGSGRPPPRVRPGSVGMPQRPERHGSIE